MRKSARSTMSLPSRCLAHLQLEPLPSAVRRSQPPTRSAAAEAEPSVQLRILSGLQPPLPRHPSAAGRPQPLRSVLEPQRPRSEAPLA